MLNISSFEQKAKQTFGSVLDRMCHIPEAYSAFSSRNPVSRKAIDRVVSYAINLLGCMGGTLSPSPQALFRKCYYIFFETSWLGMIWEMTKLNTLSLVLRPLSLYVIDKSIKNTFNLYDTVAQRILSTQFMHSYYQTGFVDLKDKDLALLQVFNKFGCNEDVARKIYRHATEEDSIPPELLARLTNKETSIHNNQVSAYVIGSLMGITPNHENLHED